MRISPVLHLSHQLIGIANAIGIVEVACEISYGDECVVRMELDAAIGSINASVACHHTYYDGNSLVCCRQSPLVGIHHGIAVDASEEHFRAFDHSGGFGIEDGILESLPRGIVGQLPVQHSMLVKPDAEQRNACRCAYPEVALTVLLNALDSKVAVTVLVADEVEAITLQVVEGESFLLSKQEDVVLAVIVLHHRHVGKELLIASPVGSVTMALSSLQVVLHQSISG